MKFLKWILTLIAGLSGIVALFAGGKSKEKVKQIKKDIKKSEKKVKKLKEENKNIKQTQKNYKKAVSELKKEKKNLNQLLVTLFFHSKPFGLKLKRMES